MWPATNFLILGKINSAVWETKSLLFCLRYDPLIVFRRQNFHKNDVTWPLSANGLLTNQTSNQSRLTWYNSLWLTVNNISPIQDYVHPDNQTQPTFEMTPGFKPFTVLLIAIKDYSALPEGLRHLGWLHKSCWDYGTCQYCCNTTVHCLRTIVNTCVILETFMQPCRQGYCCSSFFFVFPVEVISHVGCLFLVLFIGIFNATLLQ